ncbi:MAG TPA: tRNA pseudouridine(13) synthase TruD [Candidatus Thermoplasmatota archaeon]|nr:tRNA pseudouridine(13) synthase TruD [Candidatus Thermoplasmatota archaeon]
MKLKQQPGDFIVEELSNVPVLPEKDEHTVFLLEKQEIDTFDAIRRIAQRFHLSLFEIGYAGLKDRHALARQFVSIPTHYNIQDLKMDSLVLTKAGYTHKKIKIGDLLGNRFTILVRDIQEKELSDIAQRGSTIPISGVPNYFDSQRFGSVTNTTFIGKDVVLKKYEHAVKQYLTTYQKSEPKKSKDEKRRILAQWHDLSKVRVFTKPFSAVIKEFLRTNDWRAAYRKIPAHLREMYVNAYQSYVWNECVKEILKRTIEKKKLYPVEYAIGSLIFYTSLSQQELNALPKEVPTISETAVFSEQERRIVDRILAKEGLTLADFKIEAETGNFFKTRARQVVLIPDEFLISEPRRDELNSKQNTERYALQISFSLPKGSYATVITKRLFGH